MEDVNVFLDGRPRGTLPAVLVIDSDPDNLYLIELIFSYLGFQVVSAASGDEALSIAEEALPNLLAISLPPLIRDCESIVSHLKSSVHFRNVPVLAVTTVANPERGEQLIAIGCNEFICKPFMLDEFERIVYRLIYSRSSQHSL